MTHQVNSNWKNKLITSKCTTKRFQVQQEVNSEFNFEDVNVDLKLSLLKLIYGTWLVKVAKEINRVLPRKAKLNNSKYKICVGSYLPPYRDWNLLDIPGNVSFGHFFVTVMKNRYKSSTGFALPKFSLNFVIVIIK